MQGIFLEMRMPKRWEQAFFILDKLEQWMGNISKVLPEIRMRQAVLRVRQPLNTPTIVYKEKIIFISIYFRFVH